MSSGTHRVFAADLYLTVTIENDGPDGGAGLHLHAGGQGFWIARMVRSLGEDVRLHAALGGETGLVLEQLIRSAGVGLHPVARSVPTKGYVHDRRGGERIEVARVAPTPLGRHELDDLYQDVLAAASDCAVLYVTGRAGQATLPDSFYERLGADVASLGAPVVADLHGDELEALLRHGCPAVLKVSDEDLAGDGVDICDDGLRQWVERMGERGVARVVISRSDQPALAWWDGDWYRAAAPPMAVADHRGAGDSMTAALGVALARDLDARRSLALACGAGAASVTRHGLATVDARLVSELADRVEVEAGPPPGTAPS